MSSFLVMRPFLGGGGFCRFPMFEVCQGREVLHRDREVSPTGLDVPVARGPVPRVGHRPDVCFPICSLCSPDHKRVRIGRSYPTEPGACTMARGTRSDARVASEGPRPTVKGGRFYRSAGACPPRALDCVSDGEGQALALR